MHGVLVNFGAEYFIGQADFTHLFAVHVENGYACHLCSSSLFMT
jgi:hypothetical protein